MEDSIIRIAPYHYIHVLDQNTNVARIENGPKTYIRQDNERVLFPPERMVTIPPRHYCVVANPVVRDREGMPVCDGFGQARLRHGDREVRLSQDPFPLYPGEELGQVATALQVVKTNSALHLQAQLDFEDHGEKRVAGDEWLFEGPGTYIPRTEVVMICWINAIVIRHNQGLRLRARKDTRDRDGRDRVTGEEWMVRRVGAYLPGVYEEVLDVVNAFILTEKRALHLRALQTVKDMRDRVRRTGEEWLVTLAEAEAYVPGVEEEVVGQVEVTTLGTRQYCVVLDPVGADGKPQLGQKLVVKGEKSFFLQPGEHLEAGIQDTYVLSEEEGLVLRAVEAFEEKDEAGKVHCRKPGDRWMIRGPVEYVPPVTVEVLSYRHAIPLDQNEGIYVRDLKSGKVRAVIGESYMLSQDEELWEKTLPPNVEALLTPDKDPVLNRNVHQSEAGHQEEGVKKRDPTRVVTFRVPHNAAVQVYDYSQKSARVVFGPELVMLETDEQLTVLSLSGGRPKRPGVIRSLCLLLGPDFFTDVIVIETADHARLQLQLAYNWHFEVKDRSDPMESAKVFSVLDFVGDACKAIASRIRGAVASVQFDDFHKNSSRILRAAVFGLDPELRVRERLLFPQNSLCVTSVDVHSVEPVDQRTRDALQRSVQLAIEITTKSQEAAARQEAARLEQEAKGRLERQRILDQAESERARRELLLLEADSTAVESRGAARAEAESRAEASRIEGEGSVLQAKLKAQALDIETEAELERLTKARERELKYIAEQNRLEVEKTRQLSELESRRFQEMVQAIGADTIRAIAESGPELQVKLLQGLGLNSTLITDGSTPVNLFSAAKGMLGVPAMSMEHRGSE
uniref:Major vault protein n=1 Tax=Diplobatis ommata TaxID=1870830 RepID=MVP_DIPOM|nr:RecName: Full=Major vault protein; AltName: Full=MVP100; Short=P100 [Diplobatis ommata]CAA61041.1 MVP100 [Torpedo marmorata]